MSSDESWVMKFNDCILKGLLWTQALETCDGHVGEGQCFAISLQQTTIIEGVEQSG